MKNNIVDDDLWDILPSSAEVLPSGSDFSTKVIEGIELLDAQFGAEVPAFVPEMLWEAIFGQEPDSPPLRTYALLDAAKAINLVEMIETSGLDHACLFQGQALDELRDVAPWLVQLTETANLTRNLFTCDPGHPAPWHLWDKHLGVFIRTAQPLGEVRAHLRKFTRIRDSEGRWYYFRFWDPAVFAELDRVEIEQLMRGIHSVIVPQNRSALVIGPKSRLATPDLSAEPPEDLV